MGLADPVGLVPAAVGLAAPALGVRSSLSVGALLRAPGFVDFLSGSVTSPRILSFLRWRISSPAALASCLIFFFSCRKASFTALPFFWFANLLKLSVLFCIQLFCCFSTGCLVIIYPYWLVDHKPRQYLYPCFFSGGRLRGWHLGNS